jgi:hypothetical protein
MYAYGRELDMSYTATWLHRERERERRELNKGVSSKKVV